MPRALGRLHWRSCHRGQRHPRRAARGDVEDDGADRGIVFVAAVAHLEPERSALARQCVDVLADPRRNRRLPPPGRRPAGPQMPALRAARRMNPRDATGVGVSAAPHDPARHQLPPDGPAVDEPGRNRVSAEGAQRRQLSTRELPDMINIAAADADHRPRDSVPPWDSGLSSAVTSMKATSMKTYGSRGLELAQGRLCDGV